MPGVRQMLRVDERPAEWIDGELNVSHRERRDPQFHSTCIDASKVEQVVDDREQMPLVGFDPTEDGDLLLAHRTIDAHLEELEIALNRRERGAQLVAHHP